MSLTLTRRHNVDRFGYLVPTKYGNVPMVGAVATYRPGEGRFGGAVAVEEGTTNLVPSNSLKFEWWTAYSGAQVTLTQNVEFPEIGRNDATRIRTIGGTNRLKYYRTIEMSISDQACTGSVYIKNIGPKPVRFSTQLGPSVTVNPGEWTRAINSGIGDGTTHFQLRFEALNVDDDLDFIAWGPQAEHKPFATSFVDGTRAAGSLSYPTSLIAGLNALTVAAWTSGPPYWVSGYKYLVAAQTSGTSPFGDLFVLRQTTTNNNNISLWVRNDANSANAEVIYNNVWDGNWHLIVVVINKSPEPGRQPIELYVDGELVASSSNVNAVPDLSTIDETWGVQVGNWRGSLQWNGLIDELLILPYAASEEEIVSWYEAQGPLPPHPQASLQWDRQTVRPAQMVKL